ncbi:MAG TPA: hypothetical protein VIG90_19125 [Pedomonas sp.]
MNTLVIPQITTAFIRVEKIVILTGSGATYAENWSPVPPSYCRVMMAIA